VPRGRRASVLEVTPGQATYVLRRLIEDRRVAPGEVRHYVDDMHREIGDLERRLAELRAAHGGKAASTARRVPRPRRGRPPAVTGRVRRRRRSAVSPEQLASRQLQGRYLALIRQIPASKRPQYGRMVKEKGRDAAVKAMSDALKK
jgi:aminoglycoside phosphotransferase (APT) family kinase protein